LTLTAVTAGWLDAVALQQVRQVMERARKQAQSKLSEIVKALDAGQLPEGNWHAACQDCVRRAVEANGHAA
jgi:hypothetical protein